MAMRLYIFLLFSSFALTASIQSASATGTVSPAIIQHVSTSTSGGPITLTLPAVPTAGNTIYAMIGYGIYNSRSIIAPDSTWTCNSNSGSSINGSVGIDICSHIVISGDAASYIFKSTASAPQVFGALLEVSNTVSMQVAYNYDGGGNTNYLSTTTSPSLTPSVLNMLPVGIEMGGGIITPGTAGWQMVEGGGSFAVTDTTLTTNTTTPISTSFNYVYNNSGNSLQALVLLVPGLFAAAPIASPAAGNYPGQLSVALSDTTPGASIHFTANGTTPTCSSPTYSSPITVSTTTEISYLACASGYTNSAVVSSNYIIGAGTLAGISLGPLGDLHGWIPSPNDAWHQPITSLAVDSNSANIIAQIGASHLHHDWSSTYGGNYGIPYTVVDSTTTPLVPWTDTLQGDDTTVADGASQSDLALYPLPVGMLIESSPPNCAITGDNHGIVIDKHTGVGYELWHLQYCPTNPIAFGADDGTIWDFTKTEARPYDFTSADAGGLSVFEGLVRYDEILAGVIPHAIRFTTQNTRCDNYRYGDGYGAYELPATHSACTYSGSLNIYGMRLRLRAGYTNAACSSTTNQIILTAMQTYGMMLADLGGSLYFQGTPDPRWNDDDLSNCLDSIPANAFDVVQQGTVYASDRYPAGVAPIINSFTASATTIHSGDSVTLTANTTGSSYNFIDNAGFLSGNSVTVSPTQTTTYVLVASNFNLADDDTYGDGHRPTASVTVTVLPANTTPNLQFAAIAAKNTSNAPFTVSASSQSPGAITYSVVSGPATISGNTVTLTGVGTVVLQASQAASSTYAAATATTTFSVSLAILPPTTRPPILPPITRNPISPPVTRPAPTVPTPPHQ